jgi:hypothetical protein
MILIVAASLGIGFAVAWPIARRIGYREGIEEVTESILDAEIIGEVEEVK